MSITCQFNGRLGNIVLNICQLIAYAKRHNLDYYIPTNAWACTGGIPSITVPSTGIRPQSPTQYPEPVDAQGHPYFHDIPAMDNVEFIGYYQSFLYFDAYRDDILAAFNLPYHTEYGVVGISSRRGDCINQMIPGTNTFAFPIAPREYYQRAVQYMIDRGHTHFRVYGDDIKFHREEFTTNNYPGATFEYSEGRSELEDYISLQNCEHQVTARSTFSLTAGWMNRNPEKIIVCPTMEIPWWHRMNKNLLTGTEHWLTQLLW